MVVRLVNRLLYAEIWAVLWSAELPRTFQGLSHYFLGIFSGLFQKFLRIFSGLLKDFPRTFPGYVRTFSGLSQDFFRTFQDFVRTSIGLSYNYFNKCSTICLFLMIFILHVNIPFLGSRPPQPEPERVR